MEIHSTKDSHNTETDSASIPGYHTDLPSLPAPEK